MQRHYVEASCDGVALDFGESYGDLGFLRSLSNLRSLIIGAARVKDLSAVFDKTELEELGAGLNIRDLRGLHRLTKLKRLGVPFRRGIEGLAELTGIEEMSIEEWPNGQELALLGPKPQLSSLGLHLKRTAAVSSAWFESAPQLTDLQMYFGRLSDTAGLAALTEMENLRFADTKVADLDFVTSMPRLRRLELDNAGEIASLTPLRGHPALTELYVIGRTTVRDGNLDIRSHIPSLRAGSIADHPF